jgi:N-ethylmaleimide reductase
VPRRLATDEVARVVGDFARAARNAIDAGFDGVELHGASGYIFEQFLNPTINDRTDRYGGTRDKRLRFTLDVVDAVSDAIGRHRVGIRLSPWGTINGNGAFDDQEETHLALGRELGARRIAYAHVTNQTKPGEWPIAANDAVLDLLRTWRSVMPETALILAGGMDHNSADALLGDGLIDLAAFGRPFIANPDLPARLRHGWPLVVADSNAYYSGGAHGYIDYPPYRGQ